jgi:hypothetical protein
MLWAYACQGVELCRLGSCIGMPAAGRPSGGGLLSRSMDALDDSAGSDWQFLWVQLPAVCGSRASILWVKLPGEYCVVCFLYRCLQAVSLSGHRDGG